MAGELRKLLDKEAGWEEFHLIIPHPFLPPRFQNQSDQRNMILLLDRDMTLHVRWEGSRLYEHQPLTPRATYRLIQEVLKNMTTYRRGLRVFSKFVEGWGEQPFEDERTLDPIRAQERKAPDAPRIEQEEDKPIELIATLETLLDATSEAGGESPMPMEVCPDE